MPVGRAGLRILDRSACDHREHRVSTATPDGDADRERVQPEVVEPAQQGAPGVGPGEPDESEQVSRPTKLIRIASMVRTMLDEVQRAPLDDAGRRRLREIHERSLEELKDVLSPELQKELNDVVLPFTSEAPSESELRLAQAQLVGWLQGLFQGIQATLFTQQTNAQQQLDEMRRRRAIEGSGIGNPEAGPSGYL
jgi:hypothetical protein